jgi:hypothetical protein
MDDHFEAELAAARRLNDPDGFTSRRDLRRGGRSDYERTWEEADPRGADQPPGSATGHGWPVTTLDDEGEPVTIWLCQKHKEAGVEYFTDSEGEQFALPRLGGSLYVKVSTIRAAFGPDVPLRTALSLYQPPADRPPERQPRPYEGLSAKDYGVPKAGRELSSDERGSVT